MSYAINQQGGIRSINSESDLLDGETFSASEPVATVPAMPNIAGFKADMVTVLGGIEAVNTLLKPYPVFLTSLADMNWANVSALVVDALSTSTITAQEYADFQAAFDANNIPITLP